MREVTKLALRLMVFALVSALMLAGVNVLTKDIISGNERRTVNAARAAVLGDYDFAEVEEDFADYPSIKGLYVGTDAGKVVGYVYELQTQGFAGPVSMSLGLDAAGTIVGLNVTGHTETKGLGSDAEGPFISSFIGLSAGSAPAAPAAPSEPAADADTGATAETGATGEAAAETAAPTADADTGATAETGATGEAAAETAAPAADADTGATAETGATGEAAAETAAPAADADTGATAETGATADADTGATAETGATGAVEASDDVAGTAVSQVDGMTGATYSSNAVKNSVAEALLHYIANFLGGEGGAQ